VAEEDDDPEEEDEPEDDPERSRKRVRVSKEPLTYERHAPNSVFADLAAAKRGDGSATERLHRHSEEMAVEMRAHPSQTAGEGGEFIPPLWLQEEWVKLPRAGRAIADSLTKKPRPAGTNQINVPKVSTGTAVETQSDGGEVKSTDLTTTSVTGQVQTVAGQQDVSQQLLDLSQPGIDEVIFDDLVRAYATKLDQKVISGTVTNAKGLLELAGTNAVTFTQATPTAPLLYPKLASGVNKIWEGIFESPTIIAMHPRRWAFFLASLDSQNRPLIVPQGDAYNQLASVSRVAPEALVGGIMGLPVIVDPNLPITEGAGTNQDPVLIYNANNVFLYEDDMPKLRVFGEVLSNSLQVRFQAYGYYAIVAGRLPKSISKVQGTGLAEPSF